MSRAYHEAAARERYIRNLRKAQLQDLLSLITGNRNGLFSYEEVARRLRVRQELNQHIEVVPVERIVGSLGRYHDFTREFLPRASVSVDRWANLDAALNSLENVPPVELYKIGEVYFVKDGNHRVSVARANAIDSLEAYVTEMASPISLSLTDFERERWIIKMEYADFLAETRLDVLRPGADLLLTVPGQYDQVLDHIRVHRYLQNTELDRNGAHHRLSWSDGVMGWYDHIYLPVVAAIRRYSLLSEFPERSEADLYLWITQHREELAIRWNLAPLSPDDAVSTFAEVYSEKPVQRTLKTLRSGLHNTLIGDRPLGLSDEDFHSYRARHDAGERTLMETLSEDDPEP